MLLRSKTNFKITYSLEQNINKITKIFLWGLISAIVIIYLLIRNIQHDFSKGVKSGQFDRLSGEGLGMLGFFFFCYFSYSIVWIFKLNALRNNTDFHWKKMQLRVIFIFSVIPTLVIISFLLIASPDPFKHYKKIKRPDHKIEVLI